MTNVKRLIAAACVLTALALYLRRGFWPAFGWSFLAIGLFGVADELCQKQRPR